jgi:hypothetical protein
MGSRILRSQLIALLALGLGLIASTAQGLPVSGTISYLGAHQPVSVTRPIGILIFNQPIGAASKPLGGSTVTTSPGGFALDVPAGTYYLAYFLDVVPDSAPDVGEPFQLYNQRVIPPGDPLNVSGSGVTGLNLTFDDTGLLSGIAGTLTYTGTRGTVSSDSRLIVERFSAATLAGSVMGQANVRVNGGQYELLTFDTNTWYLVAYLDLNNSRTRDAGEPYTIYNHRRTSPADPVVAGTTQTAIDITFGDENLGAGATPTPTPPPTPTATNSCVPTGTAYCSDHCPPAPTIAPGCFAPGGGPCTQNPQCASNEVCIGPIGGCCACATMTPTPTNAPGTPNPTPCVGDCDGNGSVVTNEVIQLINFALGTSADCSTCPHGIPAAVSCPSGVTVSLIIQGINSALNQCSG